MIELLKKEQSINVVPFDFKSAGKGKVLETKQNNFLIELNFPPENIIKDKKSEFYSHTENGILYFESKITNIEGKVLTVENPIKHRFLQRRQFTRIKFLQEMDFSFDKKTFCVNSLDLSAGGMKIQSKESLDIDKKYEVKINLSSENQVNCLFEPIRIEKDDKGLYTVSGRFQNLSNIDKMTLVQLCMKKNLENISK